MGHVRLGKLPASKKWREIVSCLTAADVPVADLANAVAGTSEKSLTAAAKDAAFIEALWLLLKIPEAAKATCFGHALRQLGLPVQDDPSLTEVVVGLDAAIEAVKHRQACHTNDLSEMARHAAVAAIDSLARERLPQLWTPTGADEKATLASLAAPGRFGDLCQRFFTRLLGHNLHYFLDREMPKHVGRGGFAQSIGDLASFDRSVARHCEETTLIMRAFAKDWLGKNAYHCGRAVSKKDAVGFAHVALEKIRKELSVRNGS